MCLVQIPPLFLYFCGAACQQQLSPQVVISRQTAYRHATERPVGNLWQNTARAQHCVALHCWCLRQKSARCRGKITEEPTQHRAWNNRVSCGSCRRNRAVICAVHCDVGGGHALLKNLISQQRLQGCTFCTSCWYQSGDDPIRSNSFQGIAHINIIANPIENVALAWQEKIITAEQTIQY